MMSKIKDFFNKLKSNVAVMILLSILSVALIAAAIVVVCLGYSETVLGYIMYPLAAASLCFLIYSMMVLIPQIKDATIRTLKRFKFTNELLESYGYRSIIFAGCSFFINIAYAVVHAVMAGLSGSIWFGALAAYYASISFIRGSLIATCRKRKRNEDFSLEKQLKAYRNSGVLLVVLNFALVAAIVQMVISDQGFKYAGLMIYVIAVYTFYKLGLSIYNLIKAKKQDDYMVKAIKSISFADALVSILALQTAMLYAFSQNYEPRIPNSITGGVVSMLIIGIGIYMIVKGQIALRQLKKEKKSSDGKNEDKDAEISQVED